MQLTPEQLRIATILSLMVLEQEQKDIFISMARRTFAITREEEMRYTFAIRVLRLILTWFRFERVPAPTQPLKDFMLHYCFDTPPMSDVQLPLAEIVVWSTERSAVFHVLKRDIPTFDEARAFTQGAMPYRWLAPAVFEVRLARAHRDVADTGFSPITAYGFHAMGTSLLRQVFGDGRPIDRDRLRSTTTCSDEFDFMRVVVSEHSKALDTVWSKMIRL